MLECLKHKKLERGVLTEACCRVLSNVCCPTCAGQMRDLLMLGRVTLAGPIDETCLIRRAAPMCAGPMRAGLRGELWAEVCWAEASWADANRAEASHGPREAVRLLVLGVLTGAIS